MDKVLKVPSFFFFCDMVDIDHSAMIALNLQNHYVAHNSRWKSKPKKIKSREDHFENLK